MGVLGDVSEVEENKIEITVYLLKHSEFILNIIGNKVICKNKRTGGRQKKPF